MENNDIINELKLRLALLEWASFALVVAALIFLAFANLILSAVIGQFELLFVELIGDKPLPAMTRLIIMFGRSGAAHAASFLLPLSAYLYLAFNKSKRLPWVIALCVILYLMIQVLIVTAALFMPMYSILY